MWSNMKAKLKRMRGTRRHLLPGYLDEFMWLQRHGRNNVSLFALTFHERSYCILLYPRYVYYNVIIINNNNN